MPRHELATLQPLVTSAPLVQGLYILFCIAESSNKKHDMLTASSHAKKTADIDTKVSGLLSQGMIPDVPSHPHLVPAGSTTPGM